MLRFRNEREWAQFHNLKDLAISLALEASELLEHTQWKSTEDLQGYIDTHREAIGEELADIFYWILLIAHEAGIDLADAFQKKMEANEKKYPIVKSRGSSKKYTDLLA